MTDLRGLSAIILLMGGFILLVAGITIHVNWKAIPWLGAGMAIVGGVMFVSHMIFCCGYNFLRQRRAMSTLRTRRQLDAETFGRLYFPESAERAQLAARVRDALSEYLKLYLDGLHPDDDLDAVLDARTDDPSLIWHLEEVFELGQTFEDVEEFREIHKSIVSFRDLLTFVEGRLPDKQNDRL